MIPHRRSLRPARLLAAALLALSAAGCGGNRAARGDGADAASVRVENQSWVDMTVFVQREATQRVRLGTVEANNTRVFTIPRTMVGGGVGLRFIADPVGGSRTPYSNEITVAPGRQVRLTIPNRQY